eukprot:3936426-Amphidinium_carterae.1
MNSLQVQHNRTLAPRTVASCLKCPSTPESLAPSTSGRSSTTEAPCMDTLGQTKAALIVATRSYWNFPQESCSTLLSVVVNQRSTYSAERSRELQS